MRGLDALGVETPSKTPAGVGRGQTIEPFCEKYPNVHTDNEFPMVHLSFQTRTCCQPLGNHTRFGRGAANEVYWYQPLSSIAGWLIYLLGALLFQCANTSDMFEMDEELHETMVEWPLVFGGLGRGLGSLGKVVVDRINDDDDDGDGLACSMFSDRLGSIRLCHGFSRRMGNSNQMLWSSKLSH